MTTASTHPQRDADAHLSPVTVIGLGAMGSTLAHAFLDGGHPTTVWNRTAGRAAPLRERGAASAATVAEAVAASHLVVVCLLDADAVRTTLETAQDALAGRAVVNLTSTTPEQARELAAWADARGIDYLDGAIMVPTPMIGTEDALLLYSGSREVFEANEGLLGALGGAGRYLGSDAGLASLYDIGMLDIFFTGMTGFLHAVAIMRADGVETQTFLPYATGILEVLAATLPDLARDVDAGTYPGDEDNLGMELAAVDHIVRTSRARDVDPALPELVRGLIDSAVQRGHARDGFSRVIELLRAP